VPTAAPTVPSTAWSKAAARRFDFDPRDTFVVPSWATLELEAPKDVVLFSFSDRPVLEAIGLLREEFLPE